MARTLHRIIGRLRRAVQGRIRHREMYLPYVAGRQGLEIGGPSDVFRRGQPLDLYGVLGRLDNCDFSRSTVWSEQQDDRFTFDPKKEPGQTIIADGSNLVSVGPASYDFVLSCHNLEHFANPVKALMEWKRVLRPGGALILVLPFYKRTFDHRRSLTTVDHMLEDFARGTGEDDLTHLPEILAKHDLSMDRAAGTPAQFRERSQQNLANRCLHHHTFDRENSRDLLERTGWTVRCVDFAYPYHLCLLATVGGL